MKNWFSSFSFFFHRHPQSGVVRIFFCRKRKAHRSIFFCTLLRGFFSPIFSLKKNSKKKWVKKRILSMFDLFFKHWKNFQIVPLSRNHCLVNWKRIFYLHYALFFLCFFFFEKKSKEKKWWKEISLQCLLQHQLQLYVHLHELQNAYLFQQQLDKLIELLLQYGHQA